MHVAAYSSLEVLPAGFQALLAASGAVEFQNGPDWYANFLATCLDPGDRPVLVTVSGDDGAPLVLLPLRLLARPQRAGFGREMASLANFYTCAYRPAMAAVAPAVAARAVAAAVTALGRQFDILDLNALPADEALHGHLPPALAAAGVRYQCYEHFGNWYEPVPADPQRYLRARPSALRHTIARKGKQLAVAGSFAIHRRPDELEPALAAYLTVYAASWKRPEPYPGFIAGLARAAAAAGVLRLGLCRIDGAPAAAQIWLTQGGRATIFKLAHDERFQAASPGTLLTWHMLRAAIEEDAVEEVDYGRGDHAYKRDWLARRRPRAGILAFNMRTPAGLAAAARHLGGGWLRHRLSRTAPD